ncbi:MAG: FAD-dependent oxidoreductase [Erysipelotrichaceae bacterium]|nr:FAD-dependent oxidoreductase [Erysipelotrichaceae bacterium]
MVYDVIIIGGGPAGLSAAIYLGRAKYSVLVIEQEQFGGQITITAEVVNYPGVLKASGSSLTDNMKQQAQNFGAQFMNATVTKLALDKSIKKVYTDQGILESIGIVLATGAHPRKLGFKGEKEFQGRGIAYCATCDGEFFEGSELFVIGGGFAACEEALFLTQYASKITMIVREEDFTCAKSIADKVKEHPKIKIIFEVEIIEAGGHDKLEYAVFKGKDKTWRYDGDNFGIFIFAGYEPANQLFKDQLELNQGYLITDKNQQTSLPGVYGAGDICEKVLRQVVTAVSDGAIAATSLEKYVTEMKNEHHIETIAYQNTNKPLENKKDDNFISSNIHQQLQTLFNKLTNDIYLIAYINHDAYSLEMKYFLQELSSYPHIHCEYQSTNDSLYIQICNHQKQPLGITYHMIPGGHEFNSFILAIYHANNLQPLKEELIQQIKSLPSHTIQIFVSLSCTMCPEVVQSTQRISLYNSSIQTHIYDLSHHPKYKQQYHIMSVPCIVVDENKVFFGKKSIEEMIDLIRTA